MDYILYFFIFSFFGWCLETAWASFAARKYVSKQTLLKSPLCPVYGTGAIALIAAVEPVSDSYLLVFCGGFFVTSCVEYLTSLYYERFFGVMWWDYSRVRGNLNGRVCVRLSLIWGVISIVFFKALFPLAHSLVRGESEYFKLILSILLTSFFAADYRQTLIEVKKYSKGEKSAADGKFAALKTAAERK